MRRLVPACLGALLFLTAQAPGSQPNAARIIATVAQRNAAVKHFTFDVQARIALLTFPWIRFTMYGHGEYTRGGDYLVHFDNVPWFGRGFETMKMNELDPSIWPSLYDTSVESQQGDTTVLIMHDPKHQHPLKDIHATIDSNMGVREILWTYEYGGHVKLKIDSQPIQGHYLPASEEAEIVMPAYRAMAWGTFSNYHVETDESGAQ